VQDLIKQRKDMIVDILQNKGGHFYVCGNTKMGHDVQVLLKEFLGEEHFKELEQQKRLIKELWG